MKTHIKMLFLLGVFLLPWMCGCSDSQNPVKIVLPPEFDENEKPESAAGPQRFQPNQNASSPVESAVEMSEKYARLSEEAAELRQKNKNLQQENETVRQKLSKTQAELEKAQEELSQANQLIMEMRVELNNWKSDVLSFRDEMRQADIAQLQSLQKILNILGGEVPTQIATDQGTNQPQVPPDPNSR